MKNSWTRLCTVSSINHQGNYLLLSVGLEPLTFRLQKPLAHMDKTNWSHAPMKREKATLHTWTEKRPPCTHEQRKERPTHMNREKNTLHTWTERRTPCMHEQRKEHLAHMNREKNTLHTWTEKRTHLHMDKTKGYVYTWTKQNATCTQEQKATCTH